MNRINLIIKNSGNIVVTKETSRLPVIEIKDNDYHAELIWNFCISNGLQIIDYKLLGEESHQRDNGFYYRVHANILELPDTLSLITKDEYNNVLQQLCNTSDKLEDLSYHCIWNKQE